MTLVRSALSILCVLCAAVWHQPARAGFTPTDMAAAGLRLKIGAPLPADAVIQDAEGNTVRLGTLLAGRPTLLLFADFECRTMCGTVVGVLATTLQKLPLQMGRDYEVLIVNIRPGSTAQTSVAFRTHNADGTRLARSGHFLNATADTLKTLEGSVGFTAPYDAELDQYAHPTAVVVIGRDGRVRSELQPMEMTVQQVERALSDVPTGLVERVERRALICVGLGAISGPYSERILMAVRFVALACAVAITSMIGWRIRRDKSRHKGVQST